MRIRQKAGEREQHGWVIERLKQCFGFCGAPKGLQREPLNIAACCRNVLEVLCRIERFRIIDSTFGSGLSNVYHQ